MNTKADNGDDKDKQKTNKYDVHEKHLSREEHRVSESCPRQSFKANEIKMPAPALNSRSGMKNENVPRAGHSRVTAKYREQYIPRWEREPALNWDSPVSPLYLQIAVQHVVFIQRRTGYIFALTLHSLRS